MSSILPTNIIIPKIQQSILNNRQAVSSLQLSVGDILTVSIIESVSSKKTLIQIMGNKIFADSELPLKTGEQIQVRVERLHPNIELRLLKAVGQDMTKVMDYVRWQRSNPEALPVLFGEVIRLFQPGGIGGRRLAGDDVKKVLDTLRSLIFSEETKTNTLFFKDFVNRFGLLTERNLGQIIEGQHENVLNAHLSRDNLKEMLMKMAEGLRLQLANSSYAKNTEETADMLSLLKIADSLLRTIESHQMINYLYQEYENKYLIQIPILLQDDIRKGDIIIDYGIEAPDVKKKCRVIIFLNMDVLGELMIVSEIERGKFRCTIDCENQNTRDLILAAAPELLRRMESIGFSVDELKCKAGYDPQKMKTEYFQDHFLHSIDTIDIFA